MRPHTLGDARAAAATRQAEYSRLLQELSSLQTQLQNNVHACHVLKAENASLKETNEQLKLDLGRQRAKADDIRRQWHQEAKAKLSVEKKYEELIAGWNEQLEGKAKEFEELRATLAPPRDLDVLRVKIREELEVPYKEKIAGLQAAAAKYQDMFFNVRREHELLKTEFEQFTIDQGKEAESVQETHRATTMELTRQLEELQVLVDDPTPADTIRALQITAEQMVLRENKLKQELEDLRQAKEDARVMKEEAVLAFSREKGEMTARLRALELDKASADRQLESGAVAAQQLRQKLAEAVGRVDTLTKENARLGRQLENRTRAARGSDAMTTHTLDGARARWEIERGELQRKLSAEEESVVSLQMKVGQLQEEVKAGTLRTNEAVRKATAQAQSKLVAAEDKLQEVLAQAGADEGRLAAEQQRYREQLQRAESRIEALQQDKRRAEGDLAAAGAKQRQVADELATVRDEYAEQRRTHDDLEEEYKQLQAKHREHLAKEHALAVSSQRLEITVQHLEGELEQMQTELDKRQLAHENAMQDQLSLRQQLADAQSASTATQDKKYKELKHDLSRIAHRHKKRADEYKRRLIETYGRYRRASDSLKAIKSEKSGAMTALEDKLASTKRRVKELEREREVWIRGGSFGSLAASSGLRGSRASAVPSSTGAGAGAGAAAKPAP